MLFFVNLFETSLLLFCKCPLVDHAMVHAHMTALKHVNSGKKRLHEQRKLEDKRKEEKKRKSNKTNGPQRNRLSIHLKPHQLEESGFDLWGSGPKASEKTVGGDDDDDDDDDDDESSIDSGVVEARAMKSSIQARALRFNIRRATLRVQNHDEILSQSEKDELKAKAEAEELFNSHNFAIGSGAGVKLIKYEDVSLGFMTNRNRFRQFFVKLTTNSYFKNFILCLICFNAVLFAVADYENVDETGKLVANNSWRNSMNINTNIPILVIFTFEVIAKIIAMGLHGKKGSFLSSSWNWMDLIVVITGLMALDDAMENVSALRMIRILRPLRGISMLPSLKNLIGAIFASVPELGGVFSLMSFIFVVFAIWGMEMFGGASIHARCRMTPYPVNNSYVHSIHGTNYEPFRCLAANTFSTVSDDITLTKASSPWATPQDCYWPLEQTDDLRHCSLTNDGENTCIQNTVNYNEVDWTYCGSNFDARGNRRFTTDGMYGNGFYPLNDVDSYSYDLNFGYSQFDNFGTAILTIFQSITEEGWSHILYMIIDAYGRSFAVPYFILLLVIGAYFVLQLLIAVLDQNFSRAKDAALIKEQEDSLKAHLKLRAVLDADKTHLRIMLIENNSHRRKEMAEVIDKMNEQLNSEPNFTKRIVLSVYDSLKHLKEDKGKHVMDKVSMEFDMIIVGALNDDEITDSAKHVSAKESDFPSPITTSSKFKIEKLSTAEFLQFVLSKIDPITFRLHMIIALTQSVETNSTSLIQAGANHVFRNDSAFDSTLAASLTAIVLKRIEVDIKETKRNQEEINVLLRKLSNENDRMHGAAVQDFLADQDEFSDVSSEDEGRDGNEKKEKEENDLMDQNLKSVQGQPETTQSQLGQGQNYGSGSESEIDLITQEVSSEDARHRVLSDADRVSFKETETYIKNYNNVGPEERERENNATEYLEIIERHRYQENMDFYEFLSPEVKCIQCQNTMKLSDAPIKHPLKTSNESSEHEIHCSMCSDDIDFQHLQCEFCDCNVCMHCQDEIGEDHHEGDIVDYYVGDIISCCYGGEGLIANIVKSTNGIYFVAKLLNWKLANQSSPVLYLQRSAIDSLVTRSVRVESLLQAKFVNERSRKTNNMLVEKMEREEKMKPKLKASHSLVSVATTNSDSSPGDENRGVTNFVSKRFSDGAMLINRLSFRVDENDAYAFQSEHKHHHTHHRGLGYYAKLEPLHLNDFVGNCVAHALSSLFFKISSIGESVQDYMVTLMEENNKMVDGIVPEELTGWKLFKFRCYEYCLEIVEWQYFDLASGGCILLNCIILMCDSYPQSNTAKNSFDIINSLLTIVFTLELIFNVIARGFKWYIKDGISMFDAFIVFASLIDLILAPPEIIVGVSNGAGALGSLFSVISVLRCFRLFRMVSFALKVKSLKLLLVRIATTFTQLTSFAILLGVFLFIYTVAGLQFFSNRFHFDANGEVITEIGSAAWLDAPDISRYNFDNFSLSFASVFQILTTENFNDIMFDTWRVYGWVAVLFPCSIVLFGTFVLMNLFLGMLLNNFSSDDDEDEEEEEVDDNEVPSKENLPISETEPVKQSSEKSQKLLAEIEMVEINNKKYSEVSFEAAVSVGSDSDAYEIRSVDVKDIEASAGGTESNPEPVPESVETGAGETQSNSSCFSFCGATTNGADKTEKKEEEEEEEEEEAVEQVVVTNGYELLSLTESDAVESEKIFPLNKCNALGLFSPQNPVRVLFANILASPYFEVFIQFVIFLSSVSLILDTPLADPDGPSTQFYVVFEYCTTVLFTGEMILKVVTYGFALNKKAYLRNSWNCLDFFIVVTSLLSLFLNNSNLTSLKSIRSFRAFRPLRMISRAPGLRLIVNAIIESVPDVLNVLGVLLVIFSIFAVLAVNFLKGDLRHCTGDVFSDYISTNSTASTLLTYPVSWNDMNIEQKSLFGPNSPIADFSACTSFSSNAPCCPAQYMPLDYNDIPTSKNLCNCWGGDWDRVAYQVFDNYPIALMGLFIISTTEGWVDLMYAAVDSNGIDMQPILNQHYGYIYFFIGFIVIGSFFALNLFVGVVLDNFDRVKKRTSNQGMAFMTPEQQEWIKSYKIMRLITPHTIKKAPAGIIGEYLFLICEHQYFEGGTLGLILLNTVIFASAHFDESDEWKSFCIYINLTIAILLTIEMAMKIGAYRWRYLKSSWNIFDGIVTIGTNMGILLFYSGLSENVSVISTIRVFRVLRVIRLLEGMTNAKRLVDTLTYTLPGIANIGLLLALLFFIYAALGIQLFATIGYNESLDRYANFRTFGNALLTLFRFTTGEGWGNYMFDASEQIEGCQNSPEYDNDMCGFNDFFGCIPLNGCGNMMIFPYLLTFVIMISIVVLNLFVGVILEGFEATSSDDSLNHQTFKIFCKEWAKFDPDANLFINIEQFEEFIATLDAPLGLSHLYPTHKTVVNFLSKIDLKLYQIDGLPEYVHFKDALMALSTATLANGVDFESLKSLRASADLCHDVTYKQTMRSGSETVKRFQHSSGIDMSYTFKEYYAAVRVQTALRKNKLLKNKGRRKGAIHTWTERNPVKEEAKKVAAAGGDLPAETKFLMSNFKIPTPLKANALTLSKSNAKQDSSSAVNTKQPSSPFNKIQTMRNNQYEGIDSDSDDAKGAGADDPDDYEGSVTDDADDDIDLTPKPFMSLNSRKSLPAKSIHLHTPSTGRAEQTTPLSAIAKFVGLSDTVEVEQGRKQFRNGDEYVGGMLNGLMEGEGKYTYKDGASYQGSMHRGKRSGWGIYISARGEKYEGNFVNNLRHGRGIKYNLDGEIHNGVWNNGEFVEID